jgi:hypothetical protein
LLLPLLLLLLLWDMLLLWLLGFLLSRLDSVLCRAACLISAANIPASWQLGRAGSRGCADVAGFPVARTSGRLAPSCARVGPPGSSLPSAAQPG